MSGTQDRNSVPAEAPDSPPAGDTGQGSDPATVSAVGKAFEGVFREELACVERRWQAAYGEDQTERDKPTAKPTTANKLVGVAFSGGGIRSATINMGIAQALHRRGVFDHVDYMSTVSGGGYLGSSISTAMRRQGEDGEGEFPYEYQEPEEKADTTAVGEPRQVETKFLTWVRNNSNYMATGGFLDWPRIFGVLLRGILANFLVLLPILLFAAVALVWWHGDELARWEAQDQQLAAARAAAADAEAVFDQAERRAAGGDRKTRALADRAQRRARTAAAAAEAEVARAPGAGRYFRLSILFAGIFLLLVLLFPVFIRVYKVYQHGEKEESSVSTRGLVEKAFGLLLLLALAAAAIEALPLLIRWFHRMESTGLRGLYAGAGSGGALVIVTTAGKLLSNLGGLRQKVALLAVGLLGLVIPLVVTMYVADDLIYRHPPAAVSAAAQAGTTASEPTPEYLVTSYRPLALRRPFAELSFVRLLPGVLLLILGGGAGAALVGWRMSKGLPRAIVGTLATAVGILAGYGALVGASHLLHLLCTKVGADGIRADVLVLAMAGVVFAYCLLAIDVNLTSVLGLYRDRLAAAYLIGLGVPKRKRRWWWPFGAAADARSGEKRIFVESDLNLEELCGGPAPPATGGGDATAAGCGRSKAPYHILNTALNLQGSNDPMLRDRGSDFFMFSKLYYGGHRTGYCQTQRLEEVFPQMDLPTAMAISAAAAAPNSGRMTNKPLVALMTLLNVRLGYWVPHPGRLHDWLNENEKTTSGLGKRWRWRVPPWALLREMLSKVSERGKWVNLSDGGHLENMAVYELLRRRCTYIICGDGEADPSLTFGGLAILMRSARIDMGIEIEILLDDLRLDENGRSHQHAALGRIKYPPARIGDPPEYGYLLHIKSSFTGNEDETMQEYRAKNPAFPHESTADQFFDEGQFEAYRALGFHMADGLFPPREMGEKKMTFQQLETWFTKLQADLAPRLSARHTALRDQLRRISKLLRRKEFHGYFYELYPKLDERSAAERQEDQENRPGMPEIHHVVGLQLDLMESAFLSLNLDQPANWNHPGNAGWRKLFRAWTRKPDPERGETTTWFREAYEFLGHRHSGRFQNFCERTLKLPPLWQAVAPES